jgi:DHA1 family multidrug resistance protein-like MFS transporter
MPILPEEQWKKNQIAVILSATIIYAGFTFVMPFLPFFVSSLGIKGREVAIYSGITLSVAPLLAALLGPFWGKMADRFGMKIMFERVLLAISIHWFLMIFVSNIYALLALRIMLGLFSGFNAMSIMLITHGCPKDRVGRAIGTLQSCQILSLGIGPFIGGIFYDLIGFRSALGISATICYLSFFIVLLLYKDINQESLDDNRTAASDGRSKNHSFGEESHRQPGLNSDYDPQKSLKFMEVLRIPGILSIILLLFLANLVMRSFSTITPLYVEILSEIKQNLGFISGIIVSFSAFSEAISALVLVKLLSKVSPKKLIILALTFGALFTLPMSLVVSPIQFLLLRVCAGLFTGGLLALGFTTGGALLPEKSRGLSYAILSSAALLGGSFGPMMSGFIAAIHIRLTFLFCAGIYLVLILKTLAGIKRERALMAKEALKREEAPKDKPYIPLPR